MFWLLKKLEEFFSGEKKRIEDLAQLKNAEKLQHYEENKKMWKNYVSDRKKELHELS